MDFLECLTGSSSRAEILAALFLEDPRAWRAGDLAKVAGRPRQNLARELEWLVAAGVLRVVALSGRPSYALDGSSPLTQELGRLVRQTRGRVPAIREALRRLSLPVTAWLTSASCFTRGAAAVFTGGAAAVSTGGAAAVAPSGSDLFVLSYAPKSLVQLQLADVVGRDTRVYAMSAAEWMTRLQKGQVVARRARRARKLWVLGSWEELARLERRYLESRRTLRAAMADWREELSDEWDEDWEPGEVKEGTGWQPGEVKERTGWQPGEVKEGTG